MSSPLTRSSPRGFSRDGDRFSVPKHGSLCCFSRPPRVLLHRIASNVLRVEECIQHRSLPVEAPVLREQVRSPFGLWTHPPSVVVQGTKRRSSAAQFLASTGKQTTRAGFVCVNLRSYTLALTLRCGAPAVVDEACALRFLRELCSQGCRRSSRKRWRGAANARFPIVLAAVRDAATGSRRSGEPRGSLRKACRSVAQMALAENFLRFNATSRSRSIQRSNRTGDQSATANRSRAAKRWSGRHGRARSLDFKQPSKHSQVRIDFHCTLTIRVAISHCRNAVLLARKERNRCDRSDNLMLPS